MPSTGYTSVEAINSYSIDAFVRYYVDSTGLKSFADIDPQGFSQTIFRPTDRPLDYAAYAYWLQITIPFEVIKESFPDGPEQLFFYCGQHDNIQLFQNGALQKGGLIFKNQNAFGEQYYLPVQLSEGKALHFTIRVEDLVSIKGPIQSILYTKDQKEKQKFQRTERLLPYIIFSASFFSFLVFIILFSLAQFIQIKDKAYLYYSAYILVLFLYFLKAFEAKTDFVLLFSHYPGWVYYVDPFLIFIGYLLYLHFFIAFLELEKTFASTSIFLRNITLLTFLIIFPILAFAVSGKIFPYQYKIWFTFSTIFYIGTLTPILILLFRLQSKLSKYILAGTSFLLLGLVFFILVRDSHTGQAPDYFWSMNAVYGQIGVLMEVLTLSLGLGYKYKIISDEKNQAQQELLQEQHKNVDLRIKKLESEVKALNAQMNPHFIFNCLNSIKLLIQEERGEEAIKYLVEFSDLVRRIVDYSMESHISLKEDLKVCTLYLELESLRLNHNFKYEINIQEDLDTSFLDIPPFIIQPFLENAIWHGLQPKKKGCRMLHLDITEEKDIVKIVVDDNGVGREIAKRRSTNTLVRTKTSIGLKNIEGRINTLNQINDSKIQVNVQDKKDQNGAALGTRVEITMLPVYE